MFYSGMSGATMMGGMGGGGGSSANSSTATVLLGSAAVLLATAFAAAATMYSSSFSPYPSNYGTRRITDGRDRDDRLRATGSPRGTRNGAVADRRQQQQQYRYHHAPTSRSSAAAVAAAAGAGDYSDTEAEEEIIRPEEVCDIFDALYAELQSVVTRLSRSLREDILPSLLSQMEQGVAGYNKNNNATQSPSGRNNQQQEDDAAMNAYMTRIFRVEVHQAMTSKHQELLQQYDMEEQCLEEATREFLNHPEEDYYVHVQHSVDQFRQAWDRVTQYHPTTQTTKNITTAELINSLLDVSTPPSSPTATSSSSLSSSSSSSPPSLSLQQQQRQQNRQEQDQNRRSRLVLQPSQ